MRKLCCLAALSLLVGCGLDWRSDLEIACEEGHGEYRSWTDWEWAWGWNEKGEYEYKYRPVKHESCEYPAPGTR